MIHNFFILILGFIIGVSCTAYVVYWLLQPEKE